MTTEAASCTSRHVPACQLPPPYIHRRFLHADATTSPARCRPSLSLPPSKLQITRLREYYPFRVEQELLQRHAADIASQIPAGGLVLELGTGDGSKTAMLLRALIERCGFNCKPEGCLRRGEAGPLAAGSSTLHSSLPPPTCASIHPRTLPRRSQARHARRALLRRRLLRRGAATDARQPGPPAAAAAGGAGGRWADGRGGGRGLRRWWACVWIVDLTACTGLPRACLRDTVHLCISPPLPYLINTQSPAGGAGGGRVPGGRAGGAGRAPHSPAQHPVAGVFGWASLALVLWGLQRAPWLGCTARALLPAAALKPTHHTHGVTGCTSQPQPTSRQLRGRRGGGATGRALRRCRRSLPGPALHRPVEGGRGRGRKLHACVAGRAAGCSCWRFQRPAECLRPQLPPLRTRRRCGWRMTTLRVRLRPREGGAAGTNCVHGRRRACMPAPPWIHPASALWPPTQACLVPSSSTGWGTRCARWDAPRRRPALPPLAPCSDTSRW